MDQCIVPRVVVDVLVDAGVITAAAADRATLPGARPMVDRDLLSPADAETVLSYWQATRRFWQRVTAGQSAGMWVAYRLPLIDAHQVTRKGPDRADLVDEHDALCELGPLAGAVGELLGADPDVAALEAMGPVVAVDVDDAKTVVTCAVDGGDWPAVLGGAACRGEVRRWVRVTAAHAKWRDRRVRRLARVEVLADVVFPDPAEWLPAGTAVTAELAAC